MRNKKTRSMSFFTTGFTYIEIVIAIGILALLGAIGLSSFSTWQRGHALDATYRQAISFLEEARNKTLSSENSASYGVRFETDKITLFQSPFVEGASDNKEIILNNYVSISNIVLTGSASDVIFDKLSGETANYGSVVISEKNNPLNSKTITIQQNGVAR